MMRYCFLLLVSIVILNTSLSSGYTSRVDGKEGWLVKPSSGGIKLLIHDTIYFKYNKESDSELVVNKQDHDSCNTKNPIHKMEGGDSAFLLDKSGAFYFISENVENCQKGRKLNVVVWSPHRRLMSVATDAPSPSMVPAMSLAVNAPTPSVIGWNALAPSPTDIHAPAPSPTTNHAPVPSPTDNHAPTPNPTSNHALAPSAAKKKCHRHRHRGLCFGSKCHRDSCSDTAPSPGHSGSTRLSGSVGVNVVVALILGSLAF